jgi:hypothetical protein
VGVSKLLLNALGSLNNIVLNFFQQTPTASTGSCAFDRLAAKVEQLFPHLLRWERLEALQDNVYSFDM